MMSVAVCFSYYLLFGGPPRTTPAFAAPAAALLFTAGFFPGLGNLTPKTLSILTIICPLGIALPLSYSPTTCGFSLIFVAKSFCVIFFAIRACWIAFERFLSTLLCLSSSDSSIFLAFTEAVCADLFPPAPYFFSCLFFVVGVENVIIMRAMRRMKNTQFQ